MEKLCRQYNLLTEERGVVRVPFLVKGKLVLPPEMGKDEVESAFSAANSDTDYLRLPHAQLIREPIIDRGTMQYTSQVLYQVMPPLDPLDLIETDTNKLVRGPYALTVEDIVDFARAIGDGLQHNWATVERVRQLCGRTMEHPEIYLDGAFAALRSGFDPQTARSMIDRELAIWNIPGNRFLDGWVEVPAGVLSGLVPVLAHSMLDGGLAAGAAASPTCIRAMPTRQLHITAGNAPEVPMVSALRLILSKSVGAIKMPFGSTLPGAMLALSAIAAVPEHPLMQNLSIVYWQGGDESIENILFAPGAFDRIVVWGAPGAVTSVQSRALFTKIVSFNPRYGVSMIGREAFQNELKQVAFLAAMDTMIYSQKACNASLVHYVEGTAEQVKAYGQLLIEILGQWDAIAPPFTLPAARGRLKRMRRGRYAQAEWLTNTREDQHTSAVVLMPGEFDILDHPLSRLVVVRQVDDLGEALTYLHQGVSTAGVYPESRRIELRDPIAARGVTNVLPLGLCERIVPGAPHDGMIVLSELVDWKNA
jgi:hypothetical protein